MLDLLAAIVALVFCLVAAWTWLFALMGGFDREQFYFGDLGIKTIYFASAILNGLLASLLIRRLSKSTGLPPSLVDDRLLIVAAAAVAALPWAELLYAQRVDAQYFGPSIWRTTNLGALGSLVILLYLVFRIPLLTLGRERDSSLRKLLFISALGAIIAVWLYVKLSDVA